MKKQHSFLRLAPLGVALLCAAPTQAQTEAPLTDIESRLVPAVSFAGLALPIPPAQNQTWEAPENSGLDAEFWQAVEKLFAAGVADPRGLPYREITFNSGQFGFMAGSQSTTHGWVLPDEKFAVAWDGLVYPISKVGAPADVVADMTAMLADDETMRADRKAKYPDSTFSRYSYESLFGIYSDKLFTSISPLKALMLARLGQTELAGRVLTAWGDGKPFAKPLEQLAKQWIESTYSRALNAHGRRDDNMARLTLDVLVPAEKQLGTERDRDTALWQDQKRRFAEKTAAQPKLDEIATAIQDLENANSRVLGGMVIYIGGYSPAQKLIALGDQSVEPLLTTLENDTRLTRALPPSWNGRRSTQLIGVNEMALDALQVILKTQFGYGYQLSRPKEKAEIVARIREFWAKYRSIAPAERPYQILRDNSATPAQWLDAAKEIIRPVNHQPWNKTSFLAPQKQNVPFAGEILRLKTAPSVAGLLAQRSDVLALSPEGRDLLIAVNLALSAATWDKTAARPLVERRLNDVAAHKSNAFSQNALLAQLRRAADSAAADATFISWLGQHRDERHSDSYERLFSPFWRQSSQPRWQNAAQHIFANPQSLWSHFLHPRAGEGAKGFVSDPRDLLQMPLFTVPAFNAVVLKALNDPTVIGQTKVRNSKEMAFEITDSWSSSAEIPEAERANLQIGQTFPLRTADLTAYELSINWRDSGAPVFAFHWPLACRDAAIGELKTWLQAQSGNQKLVEIWEAKNARRNEL